jgi:hypothetical protein
MDEQRVPNLEEMDEQEAHRFLTDLYSRHIPEEEYNVRHPEDYTMEMPQSGERFRGRENMRAFQEAYPTTTSPSSLQVRRVLVREGLWAIERVIDTATGGYLTSWSSARLKTGRCGATDGTLRSRLRLQSGGHSGSSRWKCRLHTYLNFRERPSSRSLGDKGCYRTLDSLAGVILSPLLRIFRPWRQPEGSLPRFVIHLVGADVLTARAPAVDGPRASLDFHVLGVSLVSYQERRYGGFLFAFFYHTVVAHDDGAFSSVCPSCPAARGKTSVPGDPHENSRLRYWLPASPLDKRPSAGTWFVASTPTRAAELSCYGRYDSR